MKFYKLFTVAALILGSLSIANAQKFGYVKTQEILQALPEVKEAEATLSTFKEQLEKQYQQKIVALQTKYQSLQQKQESGDISPKQLEIEAQKLKEEETQLGQFNAQSQQKIMEKSNTLFAPIQERVKKAIDDVAAEGSYTYIFDYSLGVILYADESNDISSLVKTKLNL